MLADVDGDPSTSDYQYYHHDRIGSTRLLTSETKTELARYEYTSQGKIYASSGTGSTDYRFSGKHWDDKSDLYYFVDRYYSPDAIRWITRDPAGFIDGPNLYSYVGGNPMNRTDPLGRASYPDIANWMWKYIYMKDWDRDVYEKLKICFSTAVGCSDMCLCLKTEWSHDGGTFDYAGCCNGCREATGEGGQEGPRPIDELAEACFIATAAYGSDSKEQLATLRRFRDEVLLKSALGTSFVEFYYANSPLVADKVAQSPRLAGLVRLMLAPIVFVCNIILDFGWKAGASFMFVAIGMLTIVGRRRVRRRKAECARMRDSL